MKEKFGRFLASLRDLSGTIFVLLFGVFAVASTCLATEPSRNLEPGKLGACVKGLTQVTLSGSSIDGHIDHDTVLARLPDDIRPRMDAAARVMMAWGLKEEPMPFIGDPAEEAIDLFRALGVPESEIKSRVSARLESFLDAGRARGLSKAGGKTGMLALPVPEGPSQTELLPVEFPVRHNLQQYRDFLNRLKPMDRRANGMHSYSSSLRHAFNMAHKVGNSEQALEALVHMVILKEYEDAYKIAEKFNDDRSLMTIGMLQLVDFYDSPDRSRHHGDILFDAIEAFKRMQGDMKTQGAQLLHDLALEVTSPKFIGQVACHKSGQRVPSVEARRQAQETMDVYALRALRSTGTLIARPSGPAWESQMMIKTENLFSAIFSFGLTILLLVSCQSTAPLERSSASKDDPIKFVTSHLPLEKWHRTAECCTAQGKSFAVAAAGTYAAKAASEMNQRGCNVVDAAISATFVLAVERPQSTGIGGGGFLALHLKRKNSIVNEFVDFRETAPHSARKDMYLRNGKKVENLSRDGVHAAGTPGFVAGLFDTYQKYGSHAPRCQWSELLKPAIRLAEQGFPVYSSLVERIGFRKEVLLKDPTATKLLLPGGNALKEGDLLVQKDLAKTLQSIAKTGKRDFYSGRIAKKIVAFIKANAEPNVPYVDEADLKNYRTQFRKPLVGDYRGFKIITAPPPSAGGVTLLESLNILSGFDLRSEKSQAKYLHLLSETLLRSFADRTIIGDLPNDETYKALLTAQYAEVARKHLNLNHASSVKEIRPAEFIDQEKPHTAHTSIMDGHGNAIAVTTTVNFFFGAGRVVPNTGIFLNDEMDDFATQIGGTNISGLPGSAPNAVAPNKRPVSSMVPTIVVKDQQPILVIGAAGSSTIVSGVLQGILNDLVIWPYDVRRAIFAGRMHKQYDPSNDTLSLESGAFSSPTEAALKNMGHNIQPAKFSPQVQAVGYDPETRLMTAVHDPRDEGGAEAE